MPSFAGLVHRPPGWLKKSPCLLTQRTSIDALDVLMQVEQI
jgi:hypothetical protein